MRYVACKSFDSSVVLDGSTCITTIIHLPCRPRRYGVIH